MAEAIEARAFPGAAVWLEGAACLGAAFGTTAYEDALSRPVSLETVYDIASLSKLFTAAAVLIATREAGCGLDSVLSRFLPEPPGGTLQSITVRQLLNHSSGVCFAIQSLPGTPPRRWVERIATEPLASRPGTSVLYSCTNYFLLGRIVEALSGQSLDRYIETKLLKPLGMADTTFRPLERFSLDRIAPTEIDIATGLPWHGIVHDEAARFWSQGVGTACGNAGLFSTASDLAKFCRLWLDKGAGIVHPDDVARSFADTEHEGQLWRGLGWQLGSAGFIGERAPAGTAGHTGFTGPTLLLNPRTRHVAVILNNRVYPTRNGPNRMAYHRRIAEALFEGR